MDVEHAGAVLVVTAEGKCIIKVFPPGEEETEGPDASDGKPSPAQVPPAAPSLRAPGPPPMLILTANLQQTSPVPAAARTIPCRG